MGYIPKGYPVTPLPPTLEQAKKHSVRARECVAQPDRPGKARSRVWGGMRIGDRVYYTKDYTEYVL